MGETLKKRKRAIIFAGGEILNYSAVKAIIKPDDLIICADSGYLHAKKINIKPDLIVGDFDSLDIVPENIPKIDLPENKNYTDTTFALEAALHEKCSQIVFTGMLGGRLDHTLANLQLLAYCTHKGIESYIFDGFTQVFCVKGSKEKITRCRLKPVKDYYFSLFSFSENCVDVTIEGAKYPLSSHTLSFDIARAVSNEFTDKEVNITFKQGTLMIILTPKDA